MLRCMAHGLPHAGLRLSYGMEPFRNQSPLALLFDKLKGFVTLLLPSSLGSPSVAVVGAS